MSRPISYAAAARLVEQVANGRQEPLNSELRVLASVFHWRAENGEDQEEPALIADIYAVIFHRHRHVFRELADILRSMST